ncbi:MAG TPA: M20/M25/M40 family metallo-hydrolase [Spirochaetia bacterium]|nr:M20/M25/M40 family metallo-hydrolase [Spirochaetia bacterium]
MPITCNRDQAERLGQAVRFRTVTIASQAPRLDPRYSEFAAFVSFLKGAFPRAAAALQWEELGDLAQLLTWRPPGGEPGGVAPSTLPGLLFYAHYDVVPPGEESAWKHPPFSGLLADGHIWGRGTLDDKNILMALMEAVEALCESGFRPSRPVYLAFGGDEEARGEHGAGTIARSMRERGLRLACVFDEGSMISKGMVPSVSKPVAMIGLAEKGFANVCVSVTGSAGHSSMPGRATAAGALAAVIAAVEKNRFPPRLTPLVARFFAAVAPHASGVFRVAFRLARPLWFLLRGALTAGHSVDALLRTTQAVTLLRAGEVANVLPAEASAAINVRIRPGDTTAGALARIERTARRALPGGFKMRVGFMEGETVSEPVPEARIEPGILEAVQDAIRRVEDAVIAPFLVVATTDSRQFVPIADSIVRFMPVTMTSGDLDGIHGVDERISLENYGRMIAYYTSVIREAARSNA